MRHYGWTLALLLLAAANACQEKAPTEAAVAETAVGGTALTTGDGIMQTDTTPNLLAFYPQFSHADLVCQEMPKPSDSRVIMCLAAAFTGRRSHNFNHDNIAGNHVSGGIFHKGYDCAANTGAFAYYDGHWSFATGHHPEAVTQAADNSGMAFEQIMLIHDRRLLPTAATVKGRNRYRALCEKDGRLCIVEGRRLQDLGFFVRCLQDYGVTHALYLQPGKGWNYSWYRDNLGLAHIMHPKHHDYSTNWLTFYR